MVLYNNSDSFIGGFDTFPDFGNYHEFSFPPNDATMPPQNIRDQIIIYHLPILHFPPITITI
jgi:hypothetical protein